jgi:predicted ATP-dependent serine protease
MSEEARARIAEAVRLAAERKRLEREGQTPPATSAPSGSGTSGSQFSEKPLELVLMKDQEFPDDLFVPMKTGKHVDYVFTNDGGVPKACNYMVIGDPGVGKSTVTLDILSDLKLSGYKVLFISAEMNRIDLYGYVKRYPKFGEIDILFTGEYCDNNPKSVIEDALRPGYDIVLIDSFAEVQEDIKEVLKMSSSGSEKWLIDLMVSHNMGNNDEKKNTTFLVIQQVTKGGVFVGSNKLKHNTTGMMELRFDPETQSQYLVFSKNRRGSVAKRMFYSLAKSGDVEYDIRRFNNDENAREALAQERSLIEGEENAFDKLVFGDTSSSDDLTNPHLTAEEAAVILQSVEEEYQDDPEI